MLRAYFKMRRHLPSYFPKSGAISLIMKWPLRSGIPLVAVLSCLLPASTVLARDVSREQSAVQYARAAFEQADAEYKANLAEVERIKKEMEPLRKRLAEEKNKTGLAQKRRQEAKARLRKAEAALDRAWKE